YRLNDGTRLRLHVKYSAGREHRCHGHRGDLAYEAEVYRTVLRPIEARVPRFYGSYIDPDTGWTWLMVEHLEKCHCASDYPETMVLAAEWLGRFHAEAETRFAATPPPGLI